LRWSPAQGWRVDASLGHSTFEGSQKNTRNNGSLAVSRRVGRQFSLGASLRAFAYDLDLNDGYFDPDFYGIGEITSYWRYSPIPWAFLVELAPGLQKVTTAGDANVSLRGTARVAYRIAAGRELSLSFGYSSAGLMSFSTGASDYRYTALILGLNWTL
jgi:hypothetical protein